MASMRLVRMPFRAMAALVIRVPTVILAAGAGFSWVVTAHAGIVGDGPHLIFVEMQQDGVNGVDGLTGAASVMVSPDGAHVYVAGSYPNIDTVAVFSRNPATGALTFVEVGRDGVDDVEIDHAAGVSTVTVSPDSAHVYKVNPSIEGVSVFSRNATTGALTFVEMQRDAGPYQLRGEPISVTVSPDGAQVYVVFDLSTKVVVFARDAVTGTLTFVEEQHDGSSTGRSVTVSPDGAHVYRAGVFRGGLTVYSRDAMTGALTFVEVQEDGVNGVEGLTWATSVTVSPEGANVYVASGTLKGAVEHAVSVFSRDAATGALTFVEVLRNGVNGVDGLERAMSVTVSPNGANVYVASTDIFYGHDNTVAVFSRNGASGALTFVEVARDGVNGVDGLGGARSVTVSPDGAHVYVASLGENAVAVFAVDSDRDGLTDAVETDTGIFLSPTDTGTDPFNVDTDGDGLSDSVEVATGRNPLFFDTLSEVFVSVSEGSDATGNGTFEAPWGSIAFTMDLVRPLTSLDRIITITVAPGTYDETVQFAAHVRLTGSDPSSPTGTKIRPTDVELGAVLIQAAEDTALRDLSVELPSDAPTGVTLLQIFDVTMEVSNVVFNGEDRGGSVAIDILDPGSSASVVTDSLIERVHFGVQAIDSAAVITRNLFQDIRFDAVFVRPPTGKSAGEALTLRVGDAADRVVTGFNSFSRVEGLFVRGVDGRETRAENNDWGLATAAEIADGLGGDVDFEPFIGKILISGTLVIAVVEEVTGNLIPSARNPKVSIPALTVTEEVDRSSGLVVITPFPLGAHSVVVSANGFESQTETLTAGDSLVEVVTVALQAVAGHSPDGEGTGDGTGEGAAEGTGDGTGEGAAEGAGDGTGEGSTEGVGDGSSPTIMVCAPRDASGPSKFQLADVLAMMTVVGLLLVFTRPRVCLRRQIQPFASIHLRKK